MGKLKSQLFQILILSLCAAHVLCIGSIESKNDENPAIYDKRTFDKLLASIEGLNQKLTEIARYTSELSHEVGVLKKQNFQLNTKLELAGISRNASNSVDFSNQLKLALEESSTSYSSCEEALKYNGHSGVYSLRILNSEHSSFKVYCLKEEFNGYSAWTIIQRRQINSTHPVNFTRTWEEYRNGFGDLEYDHWLGLDKIFTLTNSTRYYLWTKIVHKTGFSSTGAYNFRIANTNDFELTFPLESKKNRHIWDCENTRFNTIDQGNSIWVNSEGGGGGFWGPCDTNFNSEILRNGRWQIYKDSPEFDATYTHLAIRQLSDD